MKNTDSGFFVDALCIHVTMKRYPFHTRRIRLYKLRLTHPQQFFVCVNISSILAHAMSFNVSHITYHGCWNMFSVAA